VCLVDGTGAPIAGAAVSLVGSDGARRAATTRANGIARWEGLPPGDARVQLDDSRHRVEEKE
jgi:hypothetical protein